MNIESYSRGRRCLTYAPSSQILSNILHMLARCWVPAKVRVALVILTLALFWTCVHRAGGSLDYELVLKPYPSLLLEVGGGEEASYNRLLGEGAFPSWLVSKNYMVIANGSYESKRQAWEYVRFGLMIFVFLGWPILLFSCFVRYLKILDKRMKMDV